MGAEGADFIVRWENRGSPVVLAFDAAEPARLWDGTWSDRPPCTVILLRDTTDAGYYGGIRGLGSSIPEAAEALRSIIAEFEPSEILACGSGLGGHAALIFGALLGAKRIVAFEPFAHLIPEELARYNDPRWERLHVRLPESSIARQFEVPSLMARNKFDGHAFVLFGTRRGNEANDSVHHNLVHAQWLARSECVSLVPFPDIRDNLWAELARRGHLEVVLRRYLFEEQGSRREATQPVAASELPAVSIPCKMEVRSQALDGGGEGLYTSASPNHDDDARPFTGEMRRWLAENLLLGQLPDGAARNLQVMGYSVGTAITEVARASESPYVRGALRLQNRLKKRDWLLSVYRTLGRLRPESDEIERRMILSRDEFYRDYYIANMPVIIEEGVDSRSMLPQWSLHDLAARFGDRTVRIRLRPNEVNRDGSLREAETQSLSFAECVEKLGREGHPEDFCLTSEDAENREALPELFGSGEDERLLEYLVEDARAGSLRLAPAGFTSPFRHEFRNLLLAVMMGRLRVKIVPSWELPRMRNTWMNLSDQNGKTLQKVPGELQVLECVIVPGDLLFLPVGWWYDIEWLRLSADVTFSNFLFPNEFPTCTLPDGRM